MKLKGTMTIELIDEASGEAETVHEENMVTDAVDNILGSNLLGMYFDSGTSSKNITVNSQLLPICPNTLGGILLFADTLEERKDNLYPVSANYPVAYASNDVNLGTDTARGSMNQTESGPIDRGYKFVWDFTTSQGNGTIAAAALTSSWGGKNVYGSLTEDGTAFVQMKAVSTAGYTNRKRWLLSNAIECDFEKEEIWSINCSNTNIITISRSRLPMVSLCVNEKLNDSSVQELESWEIEPAVFKFKKNVYYYGFFLNGWDGYWYGFCNSPNSSGNASVAWIRIDPSDFSYTEGTWTLTNVQLPTMGYRDTNYELYKTWTRACIRGGYLYTFNYGYTGFYKICLTNPSDVTFIPAGFTARGNTLGGSLAGNAMELMGDIIVGYDFLLFADDTVMQNKGNKGTQDVQTPLFCHKNFCISWATDARFMFLRTPYLGTINNLSTAVVKTADKTMKITYTLTDEGQ